MEALPRRIIKVRPADQGAACGWGRVGLALQAAGAPPAESVYLGIWCHPAQETQRLLSEPGQAPTCELERRLGVTREASGSGRAVGQLPILTHAAPLSVTPAVEGISAAPSEDNLRYFNVIILGPKSSPYQGRARRWPRCVCLPASWGRA